MKFYNFILSLFIVSNCFASVPGSVEKTPCKKPIGCQLYKYCVARYNTEHGTTVHMPEDEVQDPILREELQQLAAKIVFHDKTGNVIQPQVNAKTGRFRLPLMQDGNECGDFEIAKSIIEPYEMPNPVGRLGLLRKFDDMKSGFLYCVACESTQTPNIPHNKKNS